MKPKPIHEYEAKGDIERVYHEIRQTLRVTGVNLNFRTWASWEKFLPLMWDAMRPNAGTLIFERAGDDLRKEAVSHARLLGDIHVLPAAALGESQTFQVRAALQLYHYINPKLLVFTSTVKLALEGRQITGAGGDTAAIVPGAPETMYAMEMVEDDPDDKQIKVIFKDISATLSLSSINSDYRTLALWPQYLDQAWKALKPIVQTNEYTTASDRIRELSRERARALPFAVKLSPEAVKDTGENLDEIRNTTENFERILPPLILNIALLMREFERDESRLLSPFPADVRKTALEAR